jgi:CRP/FNR family transcriptional regulator, dissimilatory nitrate respiration regulator
MNQQPQAWDKSDQRHKAGARVFLTPAELPPNLQRRLRSHRLSPGQILVQQGDPAEYLFWVATGQIRLVSYLQQQMITYYFAETGELFEESALHFDTYGCTAIAETAAHVTAIPRAAFVDALRHSPELMERYLVSLTYRFQSLKALLELRGIYSARDRFLHYLRQRRRPGQTTIVVDKPLKLIASELALTPESLSRTLASLEADGLIRRKKRSITFLQKGLDSVTE